MTHRLWPSALSRLVLVPAGACKQHRISTHQPLFPNVSSSLGESQTLESLLGQQSVPGLIGHSPLEKNSLHFISTRGEEELRTRYINNPSLTLQSGEDPPISQIWKPSLQDTLLHPAPPSISVARPQGPGCYRLCCWSSVGFLGCMTKGAVPLVQRTRGFGKEVREKPAPWTPFSHEQPSPQCAVSHSCCD